MCTTRNLSHVQVLQQPRAPPSQAQGFFANAISKAGISVCASQNENTNFGPVISNCTLISPHPSSLSQTGSQTYLRNQPLEKAANPLVPHHTPHDLKPTLRVFKVSVLDSRLNHIQRSGNEQGSGSTGDGGHEVLHPGGFVVVREPVEVAFCEGGAAEELFCILSA